MKSKLANLSFILLLISETIVALTTTASEMEDLPTLINIGLITFVIGSQILRFLNYGFSSIGVQLFIVSTIHSEIMALYTITSIEDYTWQAIVYGIMATIQVAFFCYVYFTRKQK